MYRYETEADAELVRRARAGDVKAFSKLYGYIYKDLYRFALYTTRNPHDAEDAVSEAVIAAFENIKYLKKENSFKSWFFTILSNQCMHILHDRKRQKAKEQEKFHAEEPDYAGSEDVKRAFDALDEEDRIIIAFSVFGGYRSEEIARMMGRNASTVRSRKKRAFEKMRDMLE